MLSDATVHVLFVARSWRVANGEVERFRTARAWRLRWWLLTLPAGIGWATLRSILRLWCFFPAARSGVWSAGNGPCMRAPLIGAHYASDTARRHAFVDASTLLTHRDPRALSAARAVADVAAAIACGEWAQRPSIDCLLARLRGSRDDVDRRGCRAAGPGWGRGCGAPATISPTVVPSPSGALKRWRQGAP